jgi:hypothetical protein
MTHRIVVDLQTGTVTQVEYTAEEQAAYDAAVAAQETEVVETLVEPTVEPTQEA